MESRVSVWAVAVMADGEAIGGVLQGDVGGFRGGKGAVLRA